MNGARFRYMDLMSAYGKWFDASRILAFNSSAASYIRVDAVSTLTQFANHHEQIRIKADIVCAPANEWSRDVWSNLLPQPEDVDMGTAQDNARAPYFFPTAEKSTMDIHIWARPKADQFLRAVQVRVTLPPGLTSAHASFTANSELDYLISASFNVESAQIIGVTASHPATVPAKDAVRLGRYGSCQWVRAAAGRNDGHSGLNSVRYTRDRRPNRQYSIESGQFCVGRLRIARVHWPTGTTPAA